MIPRLTEALEFQSQALVLRADRQRLIASNIANADTPGFKSRDFDFAEALRSATGATQAGQGIADDILQPGGKAAPRLLYVHPNQTHLDSNTVDMDRERAAFVDNAVKYEATLRFINGSVRSMLDAMKSHNHG